MILQLYRKQNRSNRIVNRLAWNKFYPTRLATFIQLILPTLSFVFTCTSRPTWGINFSIHVLPTLKIKNSLMNALPFSPYYTLKTLLVFHASLPSHLSVSYFASSIMLLQLYKFLSHHSEFRIILIPRHSRSRSTHANHRFLPRDRSSV